MDDLALALSIADAADQITMRRFQAVDLHVETKPDATPVSDADTAVEAEVRRILAAERPGDAVLGEEEGLSDGAADVVADAGRRWVLDPVDGTKNFIRGMPVWGTLLALEVGGRVEAGVVSAPALGRRWWAARGLGSWTASGGAPPRRLQVSRVSRLEDAFLSYSSLDGWFARGAEGFLGLTSAVWRTRALGDFWSHCLVAEGVVDLSAEPEVSHWDVAPLQVIVEEAGGRYSDLAGDPDVTTGSIVCSNGLLHDEVLARLA